MFNLFKKKNNECNCGGACVQEEKIVETTCKCGGNCSQEEKIIENTCTCEEGCSLEPKTKSIIVLGSCCKKSTETFNNVLEAANELNIKEKIINIGDVAEIAKYGVMATPALVINNKVVAMGSLITKEQAKKLLEKEM